MLSLPFTHIMNLP